MTGRRLSWRDLLPADPLDRLLESDEPAAIDVLAIGSSKGGTGTPVPPRAPRS
jgi:hypothetical protein